MVRHHKHDGHFLKNIVFIDACGISIKGFYVLEILLHAPHFFG